MGNETKAVNIVLDATLWRALSITCARLGITKREAVTAALVRFIAENDPETYREFVDQLPKSSS